MLHGRFDAQQVPAPEWEPFGSFCFMLPQLEYLEAADCALLSLNMAWDGRYDAASDTLCCIGDGPATATAAAQQAFALLHALAPPAAASAISPVPSVGAAEHMPGRDTWGEVVGAALGVLQSDDAARYRPAFGLASLDPEMAKQEFINGGQQGLDDLLEALSGKRSEDAISMTPLASTDVDAVDCSTDSSPGQTTAELEASTAAGPLGGRGTVGSSGSAESVDAAAGSSRGSGAGSGASRHKDEPIIKLVLARRTTWPLQRPMAGVALLEALQERDPRAYQLYLSVPGEACWQTAVGVHVHGVGDVGLSASPRFRHCICSTYSTCVLLWHPPCTCHAGSKV